jgi:hypothetical protein
MTDAPHDLWTLRQVADYLGVKEKSASGTLSRGGVRAVRFRPHPVSRRAQALYNPEEVRAAAAARPGQGARAKPSLPEEAPDT